MLLPLANTVHSYPAFFIGGWIGVVGSMAVELVSLWAYLHRRRAFSWVFWRFFLANVASALIGLPAMVTVSYPPSKSVEGNIASLWLGVGAAFLITLLVEGIVFLFRCGGAAERRPVIRALVMSNFYSYAAIVALHLYLV